MNNITNIDNIYEKINKQQGGIASEVICINCKHRCIYTRPLYSLTRDLECPNCNEKGYIIETGDVLLETEYERICKANSDKEIYRHAHTIYQYEEE